jgi:molecular chaperone DnaK (HSP70)
MNSTDLQHGVVALVGEAAQYEMIHNPGNPNTIFDIKRFIGQRFNAVEIQR